MRISPLSVLIIAIIWQSSVLAQAARPSLPLDRIHLVQITRQATLIHFFVLGQDNRGAPKQVAPISASAMIGDKNVSLGISPDDRLALVVLLDLSWTGAKTFEAVRQSLGVWAAGMRTGDVTSIVTFGSSATTTIDFTADAVALSSTLGTLELANPNWPYISMHYGLMAAWREAMRLDPGLPTQRAILIVSDGTNGGGIQTDGDFSKLQQATSIPIYWIVNPAKPANAASSALEVIVRASGGQSFEVPRQDVQSAFAESRWLIYGATHLLGVCTACPTQAGVRSQVKIRTTTQTLATQFQIVPSLSN